MKTSCKQTDSTELLVSDFSHLKCSFPVTSDRTPNIDEITIELAVNEKNLPSDSANSTLKPDPLKRTRSSRRESKKKASTTRQSPEKQTGYVPAQPPHPPIEEVSNTGKTSVALQNQTPDIPLDKPQRAADTINNSDDSQKLFSDNKMDTETNTQSAPPPVIRITSSTNIDDVTQGDTINPLNITSGDEPLDLPTTSDTDNDQQQTYSSQTSLSHIRNNDRASTVDKMTDTHSEPSTTHSTEELTQPDDEINGKNTPSGASQEMQEQSEKYGIQDRHSPASEGSASLTKPTDLAESISNPSEI
ncbi:hypothetical protein CI610_00041 [invertebrate metagenome]|uniref:Uncharacterized protein n=1 Tax=invertebrate metagenome TaxID=1711999 RepID=A0A2H9TD40_9ZZZZ